jgi:transcriptional regulator with XRE-family HTH domain
MKSRNTFGKAFKKVRYVRELTQEDFSSESGRTYISELEREVKHPTLNKIDDLAQALSVHPLTVVALSYLRADNITSLTKLLAKVKEEAEIILSAEGQMEK